MLGTRGGGVHFLAAHAHFFERGAGFTPTNAAGDQLFKKRVGSCNGEGDLDRGRWDAGNGRHFVEDLLECEVFATQYLAAAGSALGERENVGAGDFGDIDQIEAGVDVRWEFGIEKVDEDTAGGRGLSVIGANGGCGV